MEPCKFGGNCWRPMCPYYHPLNLARVHRKATLWRLLADQEDGPHASMPLVQREHVAHDFSVRHHDKEETPQEQSRDKVASDLVPQIHGKPCRARRLWRNVSSSTVSTFPFHRLREKWSKSCSSTQRSSLTCPSRSWRKLRRLPSSLRKHVLPITSSSKSSTFAAHRACRIFASRTSLRSVCTSAQRRRPSTRQSHRLGRKLGRRSNLCRMHECPTASLSNRPAFVVHRRGTNRQS